ncbi:hypothetical protein RAN3_2660 [plant metagenome]|uniref:Uncharacterized protein n=1 Tax=plant metagenome TaxID=1297885 RepID=A0A484VCI1_9ZZZZ
MITDGFHAGLREKREGVEMRKTVLMSGILIYLYLAKNRDNQEILSVE